MVDSAYYLGFDFGMRCIGVAVGCFQAKPIAILKAKQGVPDWSLIEKLCKEWLVKGFVIGLADGKEVPQQFQAATKRFAASLEERYKLPCYFVDEHYTTVEAKQSAAAKNKKRHDDIAAAIILQQFLDSKDNYA